MGNGLASIVVAKWEGVLGDGPSEEDRAIVPVELG